MNPNLNPFNLNQGQQFQGLPLGVGQQYNGQMGLQQQQQQQSMGIQQHYQHPLGGMQQQQNVIGMQQIRPHPFRNQRPRPMVFNPLARTGIHPKANPITPQNQQVIEHSRQIKSRISQALDRDQHLVTNPDLMPFKDRNDMITKLMAFHVLQFPEMVLPLENDPTADLNDLEQRFEKASKEVNLEVERIMSEFASSLVDSN